MKLEVFDVEDILKMGIWLLSLNDFGEQIQKQLFGVLSRYLNQNEQDCKIY